MKRLNHAEGLIEIVGPEGDILDRIPAPKGPGVARLRLDRSPSHDGRRQTITKSRRRRLETEQDGICFICLRPWVEPTVDHVMPRRLFRGSRSEFRNQVIACYGCNLAKGDRPPTEAEVARLLALKRPYADADYDVTAVEPAPRSGWSNATAAEA